MEKYSASYGNTSCNFVFQNIQGEDFKNEYFGAYCILKNIIQRGTPTNPSLFLKEKLGEIEYDTNEKVYLISKEESKWIKTIKGNDENNDNPALYFFEKVLPDYLEEYSFVTNLIIPEMEINDIIESNNKEFYKQRVDFYIPQIKLVIEIDGEQHELPEQKTIDRQRESYLKKESIKTIRIKTKDLKEKTPVFKYHMKYICDLIKKDKELENYKRALNENEVLESVTKRIEYDSIIRFQLLILSLLQKGRISLNNETWQFTLVNNDLRIKELLNLALEDIFIWLENILKLQKIEFKKPDITIKFYDNDDEKSICIDFDILKKWTDEADYNKDVVYIRNDYDDNKDYFEVSISELIKYDISYEKDIDSFKFLLKNIFEYNDFRDGQIPIIINALKGNDTIGLLPTGAGKSLCYQFVAMLQPCISFVVCPILSLIYDQEENLSKRNINRTAYITSDMNAIQKEKVLKRFSSGKFFFIWISPERFQDEKFRETLQKINEKKNFSFAVIDEVHCLSEWGHDFRISYLNLISTIKEYCPGSILLGLTATASKFVLEDLKNEFDIESSNIKTLGSMSREELKFHLRITKNDKYKELEKILYELNQKYDNTLLNLNGKDTKSGIIFTVNRTGENGCRTLSARLNSEFEKMNLPVKVKYYDGKKEDEFENENKRITQEEFKENKIPILAATKAFGMGIDKENIRYTIHFGLPQSLEAFYQEAGRAGRNNNKELAKSDCYIIYKPEICDELITQKMFDKQSNLEDLKRNLEILENDLNSLFWLFLESNKGIEEDFRNTVYIAQYLFNKDNKDNEIITCDKLNKKADVEKAIYRLKLLGIIKDWTITGYGEDSAIIKVYKNEIKIELVKEKLIEYIQKYDVEFYPNKLEEEYGEILKDNRIKPLNRYIKVLLVWTYDTIIYTRRQAIKTIKDCCENFKSSDEFKRYIENYFKIDDKTSVLDEITANPQRYKNWFEILFINDENNIKNVIPKKAYNDLLPSIQRSLESYANNTGLNYISGITKLIYGDFNDADGKSRLEEAFKNIKKFDKKDFEIIFNKTLELVKNTGKEEILSEFLISMDPDRSNDIYIKLQDNFSLNYLIEESNKKLAKIEEEIIW